MTRTQADTPPFAHRLRAALADAKMTQERLARELGITLRAVQAWCSGRSEPKGRQLVRLGQVLDREPAWFYDDDRTLP